LIRLALFPGRLDVGMDVGSFDNLLRSHGEAIFWLVG
jgi:hypothetical protein